MMSLEIFNNDNYYLQKKGYIIIIINIILLFTLNIIFQF